MTSADDRDRQATALRRILETPALAKVVPRLRPELLHQIIQKAGLEACSEIVALATPAQLARVFDLDLWTAPRPGVEETLDAERFGVWLDVLMEAGPDVAAGKLAGMDHDITIAALSRHVRVLDRAADVRSGSDATTFDVGPYTLEPRRQDAWSTIVEFLVHLDAHHPGFFHIVMRGCRDLSSEGWERDGLDDLLAGDDQALFDLATAREARREAQGYLSPEQARVFLQMSRELRLDASAPPPSNPIAVAYFRALEGAPAEGALVQAGVQSTDMDKYAFLANALVAGCPIQGRAFTQPESADAIQAACALGREHWPEAWGAPGDPLTLFQVGWHVLYRDVAMYAAEQLLRVLVHLEAGDSETNRLLRELKTTLKKHWRDGVPWKAREALEVIMILDSPAWAALTGLIAECPVLAKSVGFELIATQAQIDAVHHFLNTLPSALSP